MPSHLRRYDEPGHVHFLTVSCYRRLPFFGTDEVRDIVVECMRGAREKLTFRWIGYVVMPEHVHWLIDPRPPAQTEPIPVSRILLSVKTSVAMRAKSWLRARWRRDRSLGHRLLDRWATWPADQKPLWTTRGIDVNVMSMGKVTEKLTYCHENPVKRGLVDRAEDWAWSSYCYYENGGSTKLAMDWDGTWPIE